jgi:hypothetical protein
MEQMRHHEFNHPRHAPAARRTVRMLSGMRVACLGFGFGALVWLVSAQVTIGASDGQIDNAKEILGRWVETQRVISKEKQDWALGREMLGSRVELLSNEIGKLREKIVENNRQVEELNTQQVTLEADNERLKAAADSLNDILVGLEGRTRGLLTRLPDPIRTRVKPLSQRLPEDPDNTKLSLSERFQNVVGILNDINKFNREITVTSERRVLADGTQAEVIALYLGIGQGYYVNSKGTIAGIGMADADGWKWVERNDIAAIVQEAIAIVKNEQVASYVRLPLLLHDVESEAQK